MFAIREMVVGDIDDVLRLAAETPEAPQWGRGAYELVAAQHTQYEASRAGWVAVNDVELLGFVIAKRVTDTSELESIVVANSARRKGIGRALLSAVTNWALASGAQKLELEVRGGNESAIAFYQGAGFIREGRRPRYYRDPEEDAVLMGTRLYSDD
ncbi:MAG: GNAT family N-acetyltransferase [Acidobacteriaceae bacterium]|nr:GNAT family N-acetyltransferase [Acidobacteriaceae bacterium]